MTKIDLARRAEIGREKRARTLSGILESALRVIADRGFDAPTIDDFVAAAGVARGTFYNYFRTREQLLAAVAAHVVDEFDRILEPIHESSDDPAYRMSVALRYFTHKSQERPHWGWVIARMIPIEGGPLSKEMRKGAMADITSGMRSGRFKIPSIEAALAFGMGVLTMSIRSVLSENVPEAFAESMAAMLLQAYGVPAREAVRIASMPIPSVSRDRAFAHPSKSSAGRRNASPRG